MSTLNFSFKTRLFRTEGRVLVSNGILEFQYIHPAIERPITLSECILTNAQYDVIAEKLEQCSTRVKITRVLWLVDEWLGELDGKDYHKGKDYSIKHFMWQFVS